MAEWVSGILGDLIELKRGYDLPQQSRQHGQVPIVSSSGISDFHAEAKVSAPGVVTGRYGTIGNVYFVEQDFWPLNTTLYVKDFKGNDPRFVSYFLRGIDFLAYSDKAAVPGLNRNHLHTAPIRYPREPRDQAALASVLSALDDKIEVNQRMNETLEVMAHAIFRDWFVDFGVTRAKMEGRAPYLAPDLWSLFPRRLDPATGLPEGWEESTIGAEVVVVGGSTPSTAEPSYWDGDINWATPKDLSILSAPVLLETSRRITQAGLGKISSGLLPAGTVLLSSRAPIGYLAISEVPVAINQGFIAMRCNKRISNVHAWLWTQANMETILQKANGSTFQEISKGNFRPIPINVAGSAVLAAFDEKVAPLYARIVANECEARSLSETRDYLLPKLMSGEIRVRDVEKRVGEAA